MAKTAKTVKKAKAVKAVKKTAKRTNRPASAKKAAGRSPRRAGSAAGKNLVIVESPAKAKTINRYLGGDYVVKASMGHVRDLPTNKMGVDLENSFAPTYEPLAGRRKLLAELKKLARSAAMVFLATDLDREGEAIAWHLAESLGVAPDRIRRAIFNEITRSAITEAFANPHAIDMDKVNAQQARRILDRIVGYQVSPLLWRKVAAGLSAGRVQSVAVRLVVERQEEIDAFTPEEYWRIEGVFTADLAGAGKLSAEWSEFLAQRNERGDGPTAAARGEFLSWKQAFRAELVKWKGKKFTSTDADVSTAVAAAVGVDVREIQRSEDPNGKGPAARRAVVIGTISDDRPDYVVRGVSQRQSRSRPPAPFTTASLQQAASVQLRMSTSRTMRTAQRLYEGIDIPGEGTVGLITYMRTDSRHLASQALGQVRSLITESYGDRYVPDKPNVYSSGERAQAAHEAIRPTDAHRRPADVRGHMRKDEFRLYELIWNRFVACQMTPAIWNITEVDIVTETPAGEANFKAVGRQLAFDGFLRVIGMPKGGDQLLPSLKTDQPVAPIQIDPTQHFTQPPPRYTEASLVKALEADGIGRPSTYASTIKTIQDRQYVRLENRSFRPTDVGKVVTKKLVTHFPREFDVRFTAHMEDELDKVEEARANWVAVLKEFYGPFSESLAKAAEEMVHAKAETQPSEYTCDTCGKEMVYRFSKNGRYLACTGYPDCKTTCPVDEKGKRIKARTTDIACPKCSKPLILRRGRYGPFLSCEDYPDCDGIVNLDKTGGIKLPSAPPLEVDLTCPKCDKPMYLRRGARGPWLGCSAFPKCRGRLGWKTLKEDQQKTLELKLINHEKENPQPTILTLDGVTVKAGYVPQDIEEPSDDVNA